MITYNNLFEQYISDDNIILSLNTAKRGDKSKRTKRRIEQMLENLDIWLPKLKRIASDFHNHKHTPKEIYDGVSRKKRKILVPTVIELVIQHMQVNVLKPIFNKGLYQHTYAAIPERGGHRGKKFLARWIKHDKKNTKYCLKVDIHHFFESIDQSILKEMLTKKIKDKRFLKQLFTVIEVTDKGLPLGFYTSQWYANWYLTEFDHYVKEQLHVKYYMRYMDDMIFLGGNKRKLHKVLVAINKYLGENLRLELKPNYSIFRVGEDGSNFIDFMGFRFYSNRTTLRRSILYKCSRKARTIHKKSLHKPLTVYDARQMLPYKGWLSDSDTYGVFCKYIKPYINFKTLTKIISRYDKKRSGI